MKITNLEILKLMLPTDEWMIIKIQTDAGIVGWGEITGSCDDIGLASLLSRTSEKLIGRNPLYIQECLSSLNQWTYPSLETIRTYATAISGIDQALWDISAKHYKVPLYKLYGADGTIEIPLYANLNKAIRNRREPGVLKEHGKQAWKAGFKMLKCTPFDEINPTNGENDLGKSFERLEALLEEVPIERVAIDCHQRFTGYTLGRMVNHVISKYGNPFWIEDPVEIREYKLMEKMCQSYPSVRWAAGEDAFTIRQIMETVKSGCYEVIMPDIKYIGGPSIAKAIIPVVEGSGCKATMHNPNGIIATAHSAHVSALCQNPLPMEYPFAAVSDRELLCIHSEIVQDGFYKFNDSPGIGVEISQDAWNEFGYCFNNCTWEKLYEN